MADSTHFKMALFVAGLLISVSPARADDGDRDAGRALAEENCARCHALGETGASPERDAPPFRTLQTKWPLENLEEAFAEGIMVGHIMPEFQLEPEQIHDLLAFLKSLPASAE